MPTYTGYVLEMLTRLKRPHPNMKQRVFSAEAPTHKEKHASFFSFVFCSSDLTCGLSRKPGSRGGGREAAGHKEDQEPVQSIFKMIISTHITYILHYYLFGKNWGEMEYQYNNSKNEI